LLKFFFFKGYNQRVYKTYVGFTPFSLPVVSFCLSLASPEAILSSSHFLFLFLTFAQARENKISLCPLLPPAG